MNKVYLFIWKNVKLFFVATDKIQGHMQTIVNQITELFAFCITMVNCPKKFQVTCLEEITIPVLIIPCPIKVQNIWGWVRHIGVGYSRQLREYQDTVNIKFNMNAVQVI